MFLLYSIRIIFLTRSESGAKGFFPRRVNYSPVFRACQAVFLFIDQYSKQMKTELPATVDQLNILRILRADVF
jgi:hypothetical protein